jgi:hypothetical protein
MTRQAKHIETGTIYTVVREGEQYLFLAEIEGGTCPVKKEFYELLPTIEEAEQAAGLTAAVKYDGNKPRLELLSVPALTATAQVMTYGALKYAPHNWRKGFQWSRLYSAALRHLLAHMSGEDKDPETGLSHLSHAACCIMFLQEHEIRKLGVDDRHKN